MARIFHSQLSSPCEFQVVSDAICAFEKNMVETFDFIVHFPSDCTLQPEELHEIISQIKDDVPEIISLKEFSANERQASESPVKGVRNVMLSADGGMPLAQVCSLLSQCKHATSPSLEDFGLDSAFRSISWLKEGGGNKETRTGGSTGFSTPSTDFEGSSRYGADSPVPTDCFAFGRAAAGGGKQQ
jgi:hypothetical protein